MNRNGRYAMSQILIVVLLRLASAGETRSKNVTADSQATSKAPMTTNSTIRQGLLSAKDSRNLIIITLSVASTGALFNAAVILAIVTDPLRALRKGAWITILNLAFADLISCLSCIFLWGAGIFKVIDNNAFWLFGWAFGVSASFFFLTFLTVQIFVITKFPLKSRFMFTNKKIVSATMAIWFLASLMGVTNLAYLLYPNDARRSLLIYAARIGVLEIVLFVQVILNIQVSVAIIKSGRSAGNDSCQNNKHRNIAKTVVMLTMILFFTAFPYFVLKQLEFFARSTYFADKNVEMWLRSVSYCYAPIAILNFTANPILYSLRLPDYRRTLLTFIGRGKSKSAIPGTPNTSLKLTNAPTNHAFPTQGTPEKQTALRSASRSSERSSPPVSAEHPL